MRIAGFWKSSSHISLTEDTRLLPPKQKTLRKAYQIDVLIS